MNNSENDYSKYENEDLFLLVERNNTENSNFTNQVLNYENNSRYCGICGQAGHNARICTSQDGYNILLTGVGHNNESLKRTIDINNNNKSYHCGTCSKAGHNARTYNATE
ncbi:hypothetical protein F8M41_007798 [Gigaspora margarita]|uniref:CCHC-type domain-containing protein n=1 Tax=Gigaspora margarita TaxID=4874 RepID=A0A8H4EVG6_GIGMA|nr:hypothetical protein F8M41_007798 [Gigaspora margarita]